MLTKPDRASRQGHPCLGALSSLCVATCSRALWRAWCAWIPPTCARERRGDPPRGIPRNGRKREAKHTPGEPPTLLGPVPAVREPPHVHRPWEGEDKHPDPKSAGAAPRRAFSGLGGAESGRSRSSSAALAGPDLPRWLPQPWAGRRRAGCGPRLPAQAGLPPGAPLLATASSSEAFPSASSHLAVSGLSLALPPILASE